ncbi:MAG TPA: selenocysteine-specific translation elongation factor [Candidatus Baltobacteraceae bacterium]|nr:selenocysteine-specific translation elongation factor [Candidatus Baltobacteraceae bacterium]
MHIVGTAGHVDHGKSALVAALTGTNPDRWLEEQLRGMTLDLGFARLDLGDGLEAGIVDVPGHERFLHNMLAGAAGMDVLLLVVDVREGVMPQTVEHLEILKYLNVRSTIVVLSKSDLVTTEELERSRNEIRSALRGTLAEHAAMVPVSSVTGSGLGQLRERIAKTLRSLTPRAADAPVYLPIDRVFALPGLGTIVTGTLMQGRIAVGDVLALEPSGRQARVRSLQIFGDNRGEASAGARVALNVPGIDRREIARGEVAVSAEFSARESFIVRFTPLAGALPLLRRRTPVHAYIGSAEILGVLRFADVPVQACEVRAELVLRTPAVAFPGVRFVVRRPSPRTLLGGGFVEGVASSEAIEGRSPIEEAARAVLRERGIAATTGADVALAANLREETARDALEALAEREEVLRVGRPEAYVDATAARGVLDRAIAELEALHRAEPWSMGATSVALARSLDVSEALLVRILAAFAESGKLAHRAGYYAAVAFTPSLTEQQRIFFEGLVPLDRSQPLLPVPFADALAKVRAAPLVGAAKAFDVLLLRGALVKVGDSLYRGTQIATLRSRVEEYLGRQGRMTAAEFRDLLGTSRKYAVPLLEWLDAQGITLRSGDHRTLRKKANAS